MTTYNNAERTVNLTHCWRNSLFLFVVGLLTYTLSFLLSLLASSIPGIRVICNTAETPKVWMFLTCPMVGFVGLVALGGILSIATVVSMLTVYYTFQATMKSIKWVSKHVFGVHLICYDDCGSPLEEEKEEKEDACDNLNVEKLKLLESNV